LGIVDPHTHSLFLLPLRLSRFQAIEDPNRTLSGRVFGPRGPLSVQFVFSWEELILELPLLPVLREPFLESVRFFFSLFPKKCAASYTDTAAISLSSRLLGNFLVSIEDHFSFSVPLPGTLPFPLWTLRSSIS